MRYNMYRPEQKFFKIDVIVSVVFSSKLRRVRHTESSSDSELNGVTPRGRQQRHHQRHRDPDTYYEERWIERRTRRRANRRRLSRQDSRSFSEEELRHHSKTSTTAKSTERQRRALSENARYDADDQEDDPETKGIVFT